MPVALTLLITLLGAALVPVLAFSAEGTSLPLAFIAYCQMAWGKRVICVPLTLWTTRSIPMPALKLTLRMLPIGLQK